MAKKQQATLESYLPKLEGNGPEIHEHVAVVEVANPAQLLELAANPKLGRFLVARLSDTVALIDPGGAKDFTDALLDQGHTPKKVKGLVP